MFLEEKRDTMVHMILVVSLLFTTRLNSCQLTKVCSFVTCFFPFMFQSNQGAVPSLSGPQTGASVQLPISHQDHVSDSTGEEEREREREREREERERWGGGGER